MNCARNYENVLNFVKVMPKILLVPFFRTRCILIHQANSVVEIYILIPSNELTDLSNHFYSYLTQPGAWKRPWLFISLVCNCAPIDDDDSFHKESETPLFFYFNATYS